MGILAFEKAMTAFFVWPVPFPMVATSKLSKSDLVGYGALSLIELTIGQRRFLTMPSMFSIDLTWNNERVENMRTSKEMLS